MSSRPGVHAMKLW